MYEQLAFGGAARLNECRDDGDDEDDGGAGATTNA
jgi:hypothetical protein